MQRTSVVAAVLASAVVGVAVVGVAVVGCTSTADASGELAANRGWETRVPQGTDEHVALASIDQ